MVDDLEFLNGLDLLEEVNFQKYLCSEEYNKNNEVLFAHEIEFSEDINEQEIIGNKSFNPNKIGRCKVLLYGREGNIPHFHIESLNRTFSSCICIYSNNYFSHGDHYKDEFNSKQRIQLNEWLNQPNAEFSKMSNWEMICVAWDRGTPDCKFKEKVTTQPDYTEMTQWKK